MAITSPKCIVEESKKTVVGQMVEDVGRQAKELVGLGSKSAKECSGLSGDRLACHLTDGCLWIGSATSIMFTHPLAMDAGDPSKRVTGCYRNAFRGSDKDSVLPFNNPHIDGMKMHVEGSFGVMYNEVREAASTASKIGAGLGKTFESMWY